MSKFFIKTVAVMAAVIGTSILSSVKAEAAALIEFSYDFDNGLGSVTGTVEGDVADDGTVDNLANLNAIYSAQPEITFDQFSDTPKPIFSIGTIEEETLFDNSVPHIFFAMTNDAGDQFQANSLITGQKAFLVSPGAGTFVQDVSKFGTWTANVAADGSKDIPEPGVALGLMVMAGCLAPTFAKRRAA
ncbi:MAG: hypothetical protein AB8B99_15490 [Phormidesmis sp.]